MSDSATGPLAMAWADDQPRTRALGDALGGEAVFVRLIRQRAVAPEQAERASEIARDLAWERIHPRYLGALGLELGAPGRMPHHSSPAQLGAQAAASR